MITVQKQDAIGRLASPFLDELVKTFMREMFHHAQPRTWGTDYMASTTLDDALGALAQRILRNTAAINVAQLLDAFREVVNHIPVS